MSVLSLQFLSKFIHEESNYDKHRYIDDSLLIEQSGLIRYDSNSKKIYFQNFNNSLLNKDSIIYSNNLLLRIKQNAIGHSVVYSIDNIESFDYSKFFFYDGFDKQKVIDDSYNKQLKLTRAITQAERELKASKEFFIPEEKLLSDVNIKYALCEWSIFLFEGEEIEELRDQQLGIKKKKIDVIEFEYSEPKYNFKFGCPKAWNYLVDYINYDYINTQYSTLIRMT